MLWRPQMRRYHFWPLIPSEQFQKIPIDQATFHGEVRTSQADTNRVHYSQWWRSTGEFVHLGIDWEDSAVVHFLQLSVSKGRALSLQYWRPMWTVSLGAILVEMMILHWEEWKSWILTLKQTRLWKIRQYSHGRFHLSSNGGTLLKIRFQIYAATHRIENRCRIWQCKCDVTACCILLADVVETR